MKPSEYGGSDTHKTNGIQPLPHDPAFVASEQMRLIYGTDPTDEESGPDINQVSAARRGRV